MAFPRRTLEGLAKTIADLKQMIQNVAIPQGTIWWFHNRTTAPVGWAICDGTNGTPNLIDRYPLGATSSIGGLVEAGLPNIYGNTGYASDTAGYAAFTGPFVKGSSGYCCGWGGYANHTNIFFDANKANPIYGNSTTVTPPSVRLLPCMKL